MTTCSAPPRVRHTSLCPRDPIPSQGGALVGKRVGRGHRERPAERDGPIRQDGIGDRDRLTGQRPGCGIEWLHHQGGAAHEDQRVLCNLEIGPALHQPDALARLVECRHVGRNRRNPLVCHVQEVPAVGEEVGEAVPVFPARRVAGDDALLAGRTAGLCRAPSPVRRGQRFERSTHRRDALESLSTDVPRADDDHVAGAPGALDVFGKGRALADRLRWPTGAVYLQELAFGDERHVAAVGRPEGRARAARPGDGLCRGAVQRPQPELPRLPVHSDVGEVRAVWRQGETVRGRVADQALLAGDEQRGAIDGWGHRGRGPRCPPHPAGETGRQRHGHPCPRQDADAAAGQRCNGRRHGTRAGRRWRRLQFQPRHADVRQTLRRVLLQAPPQQRHHGGRRRGRQPRPVGILRDDGDDRLGDVFAVEGPRAGEHFEEHGAEGPDVGAAIDGLALGLLRRHVGGRAQDHPAHRHRRGGDGRRIRLVAGRVRIRGIERLGQTEVEHLHGAVRPDLDVRGFQVAVDDALFVSGLQRLGDLPGDRQARRRAERRRAPCVARGPPLRRVPSPGR